MGRSLIPLTLALFTCALSALAEDPQKEEDKRAPIYDEQADAEKLIEEALDKADRDNKRVLVVFGGNWCGWCYKLHDVFEKEQKIKKILSWEYVVVPVDIGSLDRNQSLVEKYEADLKEHGVPFLTVLDSQGNVVTNQNTGDLEDGPNHDAQKVLAFLDEHKAEPLDAREVLEKALAEAKASERHVLVHLGAPWCGWCHRLEDFLHANRELLETDFVLAKIDTDRMANGRELAAKLRQEKSRGIPWMAVLDENGNELITSDGPQGNCGYPVLEHEVEHFMTMMEKTKRDLSPAQLDRLRERLDEAAKSWRERFGK